VFAAVHELGARAVVAERDFHWRLHGARWDYQGLGVVLADLPPPALAGAIQYRNAATALAALESLSLGAARTPLARLRERLGVLDARAAAAALTGVRLAGRFQVVPGAVEWILDIAHNEPAARVLAAQLAQRPLPRRAAGGRGLTYAVIGVLRDKDAAGIAAALAGVIDRWIVCALPGERGESAAQLAARLALPTGSFETADSVEGGCELARAAARAGDRVVVCGSVYTVGPALRWLRLY
jgi:dihydrofolate synthase/folylpolyglutamate synthase